MPKSRLLLTALGATLIGAQAAAIAAQIPAPPPQSTPAAQAQRPNVLVWMLDDVGFAQLGCFGGLIETPNIDRVARMGLRYSNYHTTPICSSSRAAFLTGRNPHSVHVGGHAAAERPYPAWDARIPAEDGTIAANLHSAGYTTLALGKWDHLPSSEMGPAGPYNHWPTGQGFDHWYGFLAADTDNWRPSLMRDKTPVPTPSEPGYHLNRDLADQAIAMIAARTARNPASPFFMYFATGTAHAPHHAPLEWIARFKGRFDQGWDKAREAILAHQIAAGIVPKGTRLAPRPAEMPAWDSLSSDRKRLYARQMEVFAGALAYADHEFGRVLEALEANGELENTIVVITSDNGASAEGATDGTYSEIQFVNARFPSAAENMPFLEAWGSDRTYPHYAMGWAVAGNTPLRYYKQTAHEGGVRVPLVMAWPKGIAARGEWRGQFVDVADIAPTILDLAGIKPATVLNDVPQSALEGISFAYTLGAPGAANRKQAQYFEMYGNKGLWSDGWTVVTTHRTQTWDMTLATSPNEPWELYHTDIDPGQTTDLAKRNPEKVAELDRLWQQQVALYDVQPIGNMSETRANAAQALPRAVAARGGKWSYRAPVSHMTAAGSPPVTMLPYRLTVDLDLPTGRETGVVFANGGHLGGTSLYLKDGVPVFVIRDLTGKASVVAAREALPRGASKLQFEFLRERGEPMVPGPIAITIRSGDRVLASGTVTTVSPTAWGVAETLDLGVDWGSTVSPDYASGAPFPGRLSNFVFDFNVK